MDDQDITEDIERDAHYRPERCFKSAAGRDLLTEVCKQLQNYERYKGRRQRARRPRDQQTFERTVEALLVNALHAPMSGRSDWVAVPLSNQVIGVASRYAAPALNRTLPTLIELMVEPEMDWLRFEPGSRGAFGTGRRSRIAVTKRLTTYAAKHGLTTSDFGVEPAEIIVLKESKEPGESADLRDYADTEQTRRMRADLATINAHLESGDLSVADSVRADTGDRCLRRFFNGGNFDCGGRLFGGFWQPMSKAQRRDALTIDGEDTVTLDFGQMAPRILYGMAGAQPPQGDLYRLRSLEPYRQGVKKVFNAMCFLKDGGSRFPKGTRQLFKPAARWEDIKAAILLYHAPIAKLLLSEPGLRIMRKESDVLVDALLDLVERGITALPVHDALIVPASRQEEASRAMLAAFERLVGVPGLVAPEALANADRMEGLRAVLSAKRPDGPDELTGTHAQDQAEAAAP